MDLPFIGFIFIFVLFVIDLIWSILQSKRKKKAVIEMTLLLRSYQDLVEEIGESTTLMYLAKMARGPQGIDPDLLADLVYKIMYRHGVYFSTLEVFKMSEIPMIQKECIVHFRIGIPELFTNLGEDEFGLSDLGTVTQKKLLWHHKQ